MKRRELVMGDSHGAYKAVREALKLAEYDKKKDLLIVLGDTQDGWSQAPELIDYYQNISRDNLIYLVGNHDSSFIEWYDGGCRRHIMHGHGGDVTERVYLNFSEDRIAEHAEWLRMQRHSYLDEHNRFFVHAGWDPLFDFNDSTQRSTEEYLWNRSFWDGMFKGRNYAKNLSEVYIGHSPTIRFKPYEDKPMNRKNVWNLDTGAAFNGRVTVMDVNTKVYWQSKKCKDHYPTERGRN